MRIVESLNGNRSDWIDNEEEEQQCEDRKNLGDDRENNEKGFWILGKGENVCDKIKVIFS